MRPRRTIASVTLTALLGVVGVTVASSASASSGYGIDVYKPVYLGYDSTVHAYEFSVYWTWLHNCSGVYCYSQDTWPFYTITPQAVGDPDIVSMVFEKPVSIKKVQLESWANCWSHPYNIETRMVGPDTGWDSASSEVQDKTWAAYQAPCPGSRTYYNWTEYNNMTDGTYTVWIQPIGCQQNFRVRGYYSHSWSDAVISPAASIPFGISLQSTDVNASWQVSNRTDGAFDDDLFIWNMCPK